MVNNQNEKKNPNSGKVAQDQPRKADDGKRAHQESEAKATTRAPLSETDYPKGAHDTVGEDMRDSREQARQYQVNQPHTDRV